MKIELSVCIGLMVLFLLLTPNTVRAISLGTVPKRNSAEIARGESTTFTVLFWNTENSSFPVSLRVKQAPEGWIVIIRPEEFMLNQSKPESPPYEDGEYIGLPGGNIRTTPVKVYVKVPGSAELGERDVFVTVSASRPTEGLSVLLEKTFRFTVKVIEAPPPEESELLNPVKDVLDRITGMFAAIPIEPHTALSISLIAGILVVSWMIYKRK